MKKILVGLVISLLVLIHPAAAFAATTTTTDAPAKSDTASPTTTTPPNTSYTYNPATGNWENDQYIWNPNTGETTAKPVTPPATTTEDQTPTPTATTTPTTPPTATATDTSNTSATLNNTVGSTAQTGDATVAGNTTGGNATSGNATAMANVINMLQSSVGSNSGVATFVATIPGDVSGNLIIDPSSLIQSSNAVSLQGNPVVTVNNQNSGQINNAIVLNAGTGNATVSDNTTGGNATSGNASAVGNVVNLMNSSVGSGQSFVGVINIQGNLMGDILLPAGFLDSLIAGNAPATSGDLTVNNTTNQSITNNVSTTATTGAATVANNTTAGNATSGSGQTKITILNLTGSQIIGNNALLVFVNVGGTWTGLIMNAPGATSAALGGGLQPFTNNGAQTTINNTGNQAITNTIVANAHTGDATVSGNTTGGNATSGNASATVNLANLINDHISLSQWFGILFINVLGNWHGSLTTAPVLNNPAVQSSDSPTASPPLFQFVPTTNTPRTQTNRTSTSYTAPTDTTDLGNVLGDAITSVKPADLLGGHTDSPNQTSDNGTSSRYNLWFPVIGFMLSGLLLGADRLWAFFRRG